MSNPALALCCELIRRASVTPEDAGCQQLLAQRLEAIGFRCQHLRFDDVDNLWAERGEDGPILVFAGHTDVVPTGPEQNWQTPPFEPTVKGEWLYGRGAADMKASLAAMVVACEQFVRVQPQHRGRMGFLITSDEEGAAINGTVKVMQWLGQQNKAIDYCLVGEPSSETVLGDVIKNGRRGSLDGVLTVHGVQGHVAYPQLADNPIHRAAPVLTALSSEHWDEGDAYFPPTALQISNIHGGTGAGNVIPGELEIRFNFRFSKAVTAAQLQQRTEAILKLHDLNYSIDWKLSGQPFITDRGALIDAMVDSIGAELGQKARLSTAGGTSDGRFIAPTGAQVAELGHINASIHKVDEAVRVDDIEALTRVYQGIIERLLGN